jgi:N-acetyl-anhydromuramyl-L-alanine amidase AmpD
MAGFETTAWPFVQARHYTKSVPGVRRKVRVLVIHDMEYDESLTAAEAVAKYFATTSTVASAHICVDADSIVQCVKDNDVAYAAPGCNSDGIQLELAGYARQTRAEWLDLYSTAMLTLAADATAQYCLKYDLPIVHLSDAQLAAGAKGIIGHYQASAVYKKSDHGDPGPNFPWDVFMALVTQAHCRRKG